MPLFYDTAGIPIQLATPNINYNALAGIRPLSFGQNPIQISAGAQWVVPEGKPYIAQGIESAIKSIGAGISARYAAEKDAKRTALAERQQALQEQKQAAQEKRNEDMHKEAMARVDAVSSGKGKQQFSLDPVIGAGGDEGDQGDASTGATNTRIAPTLDPLPLPQASSTDQVGALQGIATASPLIPSMPTMTLNGAPTGGPAMSLSVAPIAAPPKVVPVASTAAPPKVIPVAAPIAVPVELTPAEQEAEIIKKGRLSSLPLPTFEPPKPKEESKKEELPALGTPAGEKDNSQTDAVKYLPALGMLGEPSLQPEDSKPKGALARVPDIQKVNQRDMLTRYPERKDLANLQALTFNRKYPFGEVMAVSKDPTTQVPYFHVDYIDVTKERRAEIRTVEEHAATQGLKQQRLDISREAKVTAMANNYERHPTSKLMDTRKDAMQRMLTAVAEDKIARKNNAEASLGAVHQEMMDLFAQFASGKAPTEAQFKETKHAFSGLSGWQSIAKKVQFWNSGATLDERDVRTMQDLMLNTYNTSADQVNAQLTNIESILKSENPNISPIKLPVKYPLLKTKEFLKEQLGGKDLEQALIEHAKLKGEYFDDATGTLKGEMPKDKREQFLKLNPIVKDYIALKNNSFIPPNLDELKHPKKEAFGSLTYFKVPGFHASYFSAPAPSQFENGWNADGGWNTSSKE